MHKRFCSYWRILQQNKNVYSKPQTFYIPISLLCSTYWSSSLTTVLNNSVTVYSFGEKTSFGLIWLLNGNYTIGQNIFDVKGWKMIVIFTFLIRKVKWETSIANQYFLFQVIGFFFRLCICYWLTDLSSTHEGNSEVFTYPYNYVYVLYVGSY